MLRHIVLLTLAVILYVGGASLANSEEFKLANGMSVVFEQTPRTQVISVQAWVKTGSVNEVPKINGISHFLEHLVFKGTKNFKPDELDAVVESHGGRTNAGTSKDFTEYHVTIPVEFADIAFKVVSDMVFNALFIPEEIEREKPVVVQEIQRKFDDPTYEMWHDMVLDMYKGTPYEMEVIGTADNVNSFTPKQLKDYYASHYHPHNMTLVIVGDATSAQVRKLAAKYFSVASKLNPSAGYLGEWTPAIKHIKEPKAKFDKVYKRDVAQDYVVIAYPVNAISKDTPIYDVLSEMLAGGEYSLLNQRLKYDKGLVSYVSAGDMLHKRAGAYLVHFTTKTGESSKAYKELNGLLFNLSHELKADELEKAKKRLKADMVFVREHAGRLAGEIGYSYTLDMKDYYNTYSKRVDAISLADVKKLAESMFTTSPLVYATLPK